MLAIAGWEITELLKSLWRALRLISRMYSLLYLILIASASGLQATKSISDSTYAIVTHQEPNGGAYVRGISNQQVEIDIGTEGNVGRYLLTVDTGSPLLNVPCSTPASRARNCKQEQASYYKLENSMLQKNGSCTSGCYNSSSYYPEGACYWESELTGGAGYNGYSGVFGRDLVSLPESSSLPSPSSSTDSSKLSWPGSIACFDSQFFCGETDTACIAQHQTTNVCPPPPPSPSQQCPRGNGTEAGFALGPDSVSSQIFSSGLLGNHTVMSFCYLPPPINLNCQSGFLNNRSRVIFGPGGLPPSIKNLSSLHRAELKFFLFHGFLELRSQSNGAVIPSYSSKTPTRVRLTSTLLWDTGAYGQSTVPSPVFKPYFRFFQLALKAAFAKGLKIVPCPAASVPKICGSNYYKNHTTGRPMPNVCNMINLKGGRGDDAAEVSKAQAALLDLFPHSINISFEGGGVVSLPGAFIVNDCKKGGPNRGMTTSAVAVCSFVQPAPPGETYYWLSNPFFVNRYTRFEIDSWPIATNNAPAVPYIGTVYWSEPTVNDCDSIV